MKHLKFYFRPGFSLLCLFFIVLFCFLGIWQLQRYHYKKNLLATYQQRLTATPQAFSNAVEQFQHVVINGHYVNALTLLVQNQFYQGQVGFEVMTPLRIAGDKKLLLVDRGWIPAVQKVNIESVATEQQITGYIKLLNEYRFILGKNILERTQSPMVVQRVDIQEISQITHKLFYPFILRLDATQPNGFVRDWVITTVMPERHMAYVVQWFAMAMVLLIAYFCFSCERTQGK